MTNYPFLVYLLEPGKFLTKTIRFVPISEKSSDRSGITVRCRISPYDDLGELLPEVRSLIRNVGHEEFIKTGLLVCAVYGPDDCDYIAPNGTPYPSNDPPRLGRNLFDEGETAETEEDLSDLCPIGAVISLADAQIKRKNETVH